jgi:hypothetical protein
VAGRPACRTRQLLASRYRGTRVLARRFLPLLLNARARVAHSSLSRVRKVRVEPCSRSRFVALDQMPAAVDHVRRAVADAVAGLFEREAGCRQSEIRTCGGTRAGRSARAERQQIAGSSRHAIRRRSNGSGWLCRRHDAPRSCSRQMLPMKSGCRRCLRSNTPMGELPR